ncbi:recombinase family protein [Micrococcus luteus]|nr:recombinase family protein [Micrococcus luteus]
MSSADQSLARQLEALAGADLIFEEKASAKDRARPVLAEMLAYPREGDTVLVKSPGRLARSTVDLLNPLSELRAKGVAVRFADSPRSGYWHDSGDLHAHGSRCRRGARAVADRRAPGRRDRAGEEGWQVRPRTEAFGRAGGRCESARRRRRPERRRRA